MKKSNSPFWIDKNEQEVGVILNKGAWNKQCASRTHRFAKLQVLTKSSKRLSHRKTQFWDNQSHPSHSQLHFKILYFTETLQSPLSAGRWLLLHMQTHSFLKYLKYISLWAYPWCIASQQYLSNRYCTSVCFSELGGGMGPWIGHSPLSLSSIKWLWQSSCWIDKARVAMLLFKLIITVIPWHIVCFLNLPSNI